MIFFTDTQIKPEVLPQLYTHGTRATVLQKARAKMLR
jgi:hypothetical protein